MPHSRKITIATALMITAVMSAQPIAAAETYYADQGHTEVRFSWNHAGVSIQTGEFTKVKGKLVLDPDNVEKSTLNVTIDANSISTGFAPLDKHLKSKDFFEVETYPEISFTSTSVKKTGDKTADVSGNLTIHGVTKPVMLKTTMSLRGKHPLGSRIPYYKGNWAAFSATTKIDDHKAFNVGKFSTGAITISIVTEMKDRE